MVLHIPGRGAFSSVLINTRLQSQHSIQFDTGSNSTWLTTVSPHINNFGRLKAGVWEACIMHESMCRYTHHAPQIIFPAPFHALYTTNMPAAMLTGSILDAEDSFQYALSSNGAWAGYKAHQNPQFFPKLASGQSPQIRESLLVCFSLTSRAVSCRLSHFWAACCRCWAACTCCWHMAHGPDCVPVRDTRYPAGGLVG